MNETRLTMPRPLAMRLLHEAQIAGGPVAGIVAGRNEPDRYYPGSLADGAARADAEGCRPWACFAYRPGADEAPSSKDFADQPELLRITASLATKGVLQLHIWRCADGRVEECPMEIRD